jgi:microcystin-dependent protein
MGLTLPTVSVTPGPLWASEINDAFALVDQHTHVSGSGQAITSAAININGDLTFNSYNGIGLRSTRYNDQLTPLVIPTDKSCIYQVAGNLYWNNGSGVPIQLTIGSALNATSIGGIGGDYSTSTASVFYTSATQTFTFWQSSNVNATLDVGSLKIRYPASGSKFVGLNVNASQTADYSMTLPTSLPATGTSFLTVTNTGTMASAYQLDGVTIQASGGTTIQVVDSSISLAKLSSAVLAFLVPSGTINAFGGATAPTGYLACDGGSYARATYPTLFAAIGTTWGIGTDATTFTTFQVPDLRSQFLRGASLGNTLDPDRAARTAQQSGTFTLVGSTVSASSTVTVSSTASLAPGMSVTGTNIPASSVVLAILTSTTFQLGNTSRTPVSASATGSSITFTFSKSATADFVGSLQATALIAHAHTVWKNIGGLAAASNQFAVSANFGQGTWDTQGVAAGPATSSENRPTNAYVNYIIKT